MTTGTNSDPLARRILWALVAGVVLGAAARGVVVVWPEATVSVQWIAREVLDPFGQVFLRLLFFVVVPLVFCSLALGVVTNAEDVRWFLTAFEDVLVQIHRFPGPA